VGITSWNQDTGLKFLIAVERSKNMQKLVTYSENLMGRIEKFGGFKLYALALFLLMFLAYNAQFWRMGFYYDDWEGIFLYKQNFSFWQIWEYFLSDRPFSALVHVGYNPLFGASALAWRSFAMILNWAAVILFVRTLLTIWPRAVLHAAWIGMLLVVYPGISRLLVPKTSMPHYTGLFLFVLSIYLMVQAVKNERHRVLFTALSVSLGCVQVLIIEYFTGLELIRFFLIFYLVQQQGGSFLSNLRRSFLTTLPYLIPFAFFVYYKLWLLPGWQEAYEIEGHTLRFLLDFNAAPLLALTTYLNRILQDVFFAGFYIWTIPFAPEEFEISSRAMIFSWLAGIVAAVMVALVIETWVRRVPSQQQAIKNTFLIPLLALLSMLVGGIPVWMIGRQALYGAWNDRFFFGLFLGAVSLLVITILWFMRRETRAMQHLALAILMTSAFALQFQSANKYALNWQKQRDFFWQLKWRIPSLQADAFIVSPNSPVAYNVNYQTAFSLNMIYNPGNASQDLRHWWYNGNEHLPAYIEKQANAVEPLSENFRNISFESDMTRAVPVLYRLSIACLLVADPIYLEAPLLWPNERSMFLTTHPEMILTEDLPMPVDVFGLEPARDWCYYFQKADLARQYARWDDILPLWEQADSQGLKPAYGPEYLPFIEASARLDDWKSARTFTRLALETTDNMQPLLCSNWERILQTTPASPDAQEVWESLDAELACQAG
jgi:hypothetical protein